jgi:hypothetical protein
VAEFCCHALGNLGLAVAWPDLLTCFREENDYRAGFLVL